ncbi:hypothetical protein ERO13_A07G032100v2 [Gossypium hirsutum]|nr:hypothetical protein ERO13_A07G032100v2 [Gossypium hirsutum]
MKSPAFARRVRKERKWESFSENRRAVEPRIGPQGVLGLGAKRKTDGGRRNTSSLCRRSRMRRLPFWCNETGEPSLGCWSY